jgi:hypothetical protein
MTRGAITNLPVDRAMKGWPTYRQLPAIALLIVLTLSLCVTVHAGSGTITISGAAPEITSIAIDNYTTTGGNFTHISSVDTSYTIVLNVADADLLTDERKIEVQLYTDTYNATTGDIKRHYSFLWTCDGGFANVGPDGYFDAGHSSRPSDLAVTSGVFNFVFKLNKLAIYTNWRGGTGDLNSPHWTVEAHVWDKSGNQGYRSNTFDVDLYQGLSINTSVTWTGLHAHSYSNPATLNPGTWTYASNAISKINITATTPTNAFSDTLPVRSVWVATSDTGENAQNFTNTSTAWLTVNDEAQESQSVYWFVDIPAGQATGAYTFTYYVTIQFSYYAS